MSATAQLTPRQQQYREWYQLNKAKVCAKKRAEYHARAERIASTKAKRHALASLSQASAQATEQATVPTMAPVSEPSSKQLAAQQAAAKQRTRDRLADKLLARELGIDIEDLA